MIEPCDKLLDCCAAPGGKSVRLSYKCGEVTSCDVYEHRVNLISEYADRSVDVAITLYMQDYIVANTGVQPKIDGKGKIVA